MEKTAGLMTAKRSSVIMRSAAATAHGLTSVLLSLTIRAMETTKLSSKGQVVLPKSVRDARGWREGTEFVIETVADGVVLRTKKLFPPTSIDQVAGSLTYKGPPKTQEDFDRGILAEVARRDRRPRLNRAK